MKDSDLVCMVCGGKASAEFARALASGWPRCCGYTMRLEKTTADIDAAVGSVVRSQLPRTQKPQFSETQPNESDTEPPSRPDIGLPRCPSCGQPNKTDALCRWCLAAQKPQSARPTRTEAEYVEADMLADERQRPR